MTGRTAPGRADFAALAALSGAGLAYEILLLRVFSYAQWHHFASLAVSLALLGFGVAGTVLALLGQRAIRLGNRLFLAGLLTGTTGMLLGFALARFIRVRPLFAVWDLGELAKLLLLDFAAFLPFFGIALCIGQVFMRWPDATRKLYAANLLGSAAGAIAAAFLMAGLFLEQAILVAPLALLLTASGFATARFRSRWIPAGGLLASLLLGVWILAGPPSFPLSDFKQLAYLLDLPDSEVLERRPGLRNELTVVRSDSIRHAPGLSLHWTGSVPPRDALVLGSDRMIPLPRSFGDQAPAHSRATLAALPAELRPSGGFTVLGAGGWLPADAFPRSRTTWVQPEGSVFDLFRERGMAGTTLRKGDPRAFLYSDFHDASVILFDGAYAARDAASEDYLMTTGALGQAFDRLAGDGLIAVPLSLSFPPRYMPKLLGMATGMLKTQGVSDPARHIALLRSMLDGLLIVAKNPLTETDIASIRAFSGKWGFDLAALPGLQPGESNRFHRLPEPAYSEAARAILSGSGEFPASADWYVRNPATDARPYFGHSMKWRNLPGLVAGFGRQGLVWLDWAILATVAKLAVAAILAAGLILLPLGKLPPGTGPVTRTRVCLYFAALGLGFLLLEMAVFQRALLFLGDPVLTAAAVFATFLTGAGIGSLGAPQSGKRRIPPLIFIPILASAAFLFAVLFTAAAPLLRLPGPARLAILLLASLPLAWSLGRAFPWGLRQLAHTPHLIPWAWGINGFFSVIAAPVATLLSIHFGQPLSWLAAAACYLLAAAVALKFSQNSKKSLNLP